MERLQNKGRSSHLSYAKIHSSPVSIQTECSFLNYSTCIRFYAESLDPSLWSPRVRNPAMSIQPRLIQRHRSELHMEDPDFPYLLPLFLGRARDEASFLPFFCWDFKNLRMRNNYNSAFFQHQCTIERNLTQRYISRNTSSTASEFSPMSSKYSKGLNEPLRNNDASENYIK